MVKGISRQVIVVHAPDPKLFEQAIFILKDEAVGKEGITDELLLKEADRLIRFSGARRSGFRYGAFLWAGCGAAVSSIFWIISLLL